MPECRGTCLKRTPPSYMVECPAKTKRWKELKPPIHVVWVLIERNVDGTSYQSNPNSNSITNYRRRLGFGNKRAEKYGHAYLAQTPAQKQEEQNWCPSVSNNLKSKYRSSIYRKQKYLKRVES